MNTARTSRGRDTKLGDILILAATLATLLLGLVV